MMNDVRSQKAMDHALEHAMDDALDASELSSAASGMHAFGGDIAYHEIANEITRESHLVRVDVIEQLRSNIAQLEDLHGRLQFMMREVHSLIGKRG
ncbi:MAG: hypothetical protein NDI61_05870 [Bdellovibrionaceae bacterium]|nr:hypothetical protein [Pseudobdellovibrionaceae bacterium]